jgi:hypothetical protein
VKCPIGKFQDKIAFHMCDPCETHMWTLGLDGASLCTSIPTPHPTPNPTPLPTAAPTAYPTSYPTAYPTVATPTAEETAAHTSATSTVLSLAGVTAQEFGSTQRQAVLEAVAADYDVHVSQVSLEVLSGRRLTEATEATEAVNPLRVKIRVRCRQAKALQVKAKMALLAASPALQSLFASLVDNFLAQHGSALAISVASIADPVVATGAPTAYPTPFPTSYPTPYPTQYPTQYPTPYPTPLATLSPGADAYCLLVNGLCWLWVSPCSGRCSQVPMPTAKPNWCPGGARYAMPDEWHASAVELNNRRSEFHGKCSR